LSAFARSSFKKLFLIVCLAGLSWFATYVGMLELIAQYRRRLLRSKGRQWPINRQSEALTRRNRTSVKPSLTLFLLFMARQGQAP
jgi:hypothetical protein